MIGLTWVTHPSSGHFIVPTESRAVHAASEREGPGPRGRGGNKHGHRGNFACNYSLCLVRIPLVATDRLQLRKVKGRMEVPACVTGERL